MIATEILLDSGASIHFFPKGSTLFSEGETARYYCQIVSGTVKMNNINDEGKEFVQGIFTTGDSFGEPPILTGHPYPANAVALTDAEVMLLPRDSFFALLQRSPAASMAITRRLAERLYYKSVMAAEISSQDPEHRLLTLIDYLKIHVGGIDPSQKYCVMLSRQQLADLTGLRVETVIRAVKTLERNRQLTITDRKIYR